MVAEVARFAGMKTAQFESYTQYFSTRRRPGMCAPLTARATGTPCLAPWPWQRESAGRRERCPKHRDRRHSGIPRRMWESSWETGGAGRTGKVGISKG